MNKNEISPNLLSDKTLAAVPFLGRSIRARRTRRVLRIVSWSVLAMVLVLLVWGGRCFSDLRFIYQQYTLAGGQIETAKFLIDKNEYAPGAGAAASAIGLLTVSGDRLEEYNSRFWTRNSLLEPYIDYGLLLIEYRLMLARSLLWLGEIKDEGWLRGDLYRQLPEMHGTLANIELYTGRIENSQALNRIDSFLNAPPDGREKPVADLEKATLDLALLGDLTGRAGERFYTVVIFDGSRQGPAGGDVVGVLGLRVNGGRISGYENTGLSGELTVNSLLDSDNLKHLARGRSGGPDCDGILFFDLEIIESYNIEAGEDASNFRELADLFLDGGGEGRDFSGGSFLLNALNERKLALHLFDQDLNDLVYQRGWGVLARPGRSDYLMIVDDNVSGVGDFRIRKRLNYKLDQSLNGLFAELLLFYAHDTGSEDDYINDLSVVVPRGSVLLSSDADGVAVGDLQNKTVFSLRLRIAPGEIRSVSFRYKLPEIVDYQLSRGQYGLYLQKQIGGSFDFSTVDVSFLNEIISYSPTGYYVNKTSKNSLKWEDRFATDRLYTINTNIK